MSVYRKFVVLCFRIASVFRFAILPYYRRVAVANLDTSILNIFCFFFGLVVFSFFAIALAI